MFSRRTESALSPTLRHAVGGARQRIAESMLIFGRTRTHGAGLSVRVKYAPISPTWGVNNRSVAFEYPILNREPGELSTASLAWMRTRGRFSIHRCNDRRIRARH